MNSINFLLAGCIVHAFPNYWCNTWIVNFMYESGNSCRWARYTHPANLHPTRPCNWLCFQSAFSIVFDDPLVPPFLPSPSILRQTVAKLLLSIYSASPPHEKPTTNPIHPGIINRFEYHLTSSHLPSSSFLLLSKIETNCLEEGSFACNTPSFSSFHQGFKLKIGKK